MKITVKSKRVITGVMVAMLLLPQMLLADRRISVDESPNAGVMTADLIIARPIGAALTVLGTAAFVVSLPFTLLAGNTSDAAETLMIAPATSTFMRCLGCRQNGYSYRDIDKNNARKERNAKAGAEPQEMARE